MGFETETVDRLSGLMQTNQGNLRIGYDVIGQKMVAWVKKPDELKLTKGTHLYGNEIHVDAEDGRRPLVYQVCIETL